MGFVRALVLTTALGVASMSMRVIFLFGIDTEAWSSSVGGDNDGDGLGNREEREERDLWPAAALARSRARGDGSGEIRRGDSGLRCRGQLENHPRTLNTNLNGVGSFRLRTRRGLFTLPVCAMLLA